MRLTSLTNSDNVKYHSRGRRHYVVVIFAPFLIHLSVKLNDAIEQNEILTIYFLSDHLAYKSDQLTRAQPI